MNMDGRAKMFTLFCISSISANKSSFWYVMGKKHMKREKKELEETNELDCLQNWSFLARICSKKKNLKTENKNCMFGEMPQYTSLFLVYGIHRLEFIIFATHTKKKNIQDIYITIALV